jgi:murein DD-endopeptidase MepM/ murein hydrolase activator NlpD
LIASGKSSSAHERKRNFEKGKIFERSHYSAVSIIKALSVVLAALLFSACPHYSSGLPPSLRLPPLKRDVPASGIFHAVVPGDTLSGIAKAYDVDLQVLAEVNNLKPPYSINVNSKIFVPGASDTRRVELSPSTVQEKPEVKDFSGLLAWPVDGKVISEFGVRGGTQYNGITIQAPENAPVRAAAGGRVGHVGNIPGYGNVVLMEHANRMVTVYAHLKDIKVSQGDTISQNHVIGTVGTSGRTEEPNLYFEVRSKSKPRNPLFFLDRKSDPNQTG